MHSGHCSAVQCRQCLNKEGGWLGRVGNKKPSDFRNGACNADAEFRARDKKIIMPNGTPASPSPIGFLLFSVSERVKESIRVYKRRLHMEPIKRPQWPAVDDRGRAVLLFSSSQVASRKHVRVRCREMPCRLLGWVNTWQHSHKAGSGDGAVHGGCGSQFTGNASFYS